MKYRKLFIGNLLIIFPSVALISQQNTGGASQPPGPSLSFAAVGLEPISSIVLKSTGYLEGCSAQLPWPLS